jgi:predicted amidophosphoribosyltransferase
VKLSHLTRSFRRVIRAPFEDLLDALLPARCPGCGRRGALVCTACATTLVAAPPAAPPPPVAWWTACFAYQGVARELVARAKYRNERRFLVAVARELARAVEDAPRPIEFVTWAPASAARVHAHGVDHGELLARAVARLVGVRCAARLTRSPSPAQTGLDARARRIGPPLRATSHAGAATVLVVDDVATTGGTLAAAGRALRGAGADVVFAATIARTPHPGAFSPGSIPGAAAYTSGTQPALGHRGIR